MQARVRTAGLLVILVPMLGGSVGCFRFGGAPAGGGMPMVPATGAPAGAAMPAQPTMPPAGGPAQPNAGMGLPASGTPGTGVTAGNPTAAPNPTAPGPQGPPPAGGHSPFELEVAAAALVYINQERANVGSPPLEFDQRLMQAAYDHTQDQATRGYMGHVTQGTEGRSAEEFGYQTFPGEGGGNGVWGHHRAARRGLPMSDITNYNENCGEVLDPREGWQGARQNTGRTEAERLAHEAVYGYEMSKGDGEPWGGHWGNMLNPKWRFVGLATTLRSAGDGKGRDTQLFWNGQ